MSYETNHAIMCKAVCHKIKWTYKDKFDNHSFTTFSDIIATDQKKLTKSFKSYLETETVKLFTELMKSFEVLLKELKEYQYHLSKSYVFSGLTGVGYVFHQYGKAFNLDNYIAKSIEMIEKCIATYDSPKNNLKNILTKQGTEPIVECPYALAAIIQPDKIKTQFYIDKLLYRAKYVCMNIQEDYTPEIIGDKYKYNYSNNFLNGKAGYLASLLFINVNISPPPVADEIIKQVADVIIKYGKEYATSHKIPSPLMYPTRLSGADGLAGILYILLQARRYLTNEQIHDYIKPTLFYLQSKVQFFSGSDNNTKGLDSVCWRYGAAGIIPLFCLASQVYKDNDGTKFFETAERYAETIWQAGLLTHDYSLFHGIAGSGFSFLHLFRYTQDVKYLYRAGKFAEWCLHQMQEMVYRNRTYPSTINLCLSKGYAGILHYLLSIHTPNTAQFPMFDLEYKAYINLQS